MRFILLFLCFPTTCLAKEKQIDFLCYEIDDS